MSALLDQRPQSGLMKQVREQEQAFGEVLRLTAQNLVKNKGETPLMHNYLARSLKLLANSENYSEMYVPWPKGMPELTHHWSVAAWPFWAA